MGEIAQGELRESTVDARKMTVTLESRWCGHFTLALLSFHAFTPYAMIQERHGSR